MGESVPQLRESGFEIETRLQSFFSPALSSGILNKIYVFFFFNPQIKML